MPKSSVVKKEKAYRQHCKLYSYIIVSSINRQCCEETSPSENVYPNIHLQDALRQGLSPSGVIHANSSRSPSEEEMGRNDEESIRPTSAEQAREISPHSAFFLLCTR